MSFDYTKAKFNFVEQRNKLFIFSLVLILVGFGVLFIKGLNLGIDFTHGTKVRVSADHPLSVDKLQQEFEAINLDPVKIVLKGENQNIASARFDSELEQDQVIKAKEHFKEIYGQAPAISTVSPQVGRDIAKSAILAVAVASIGIVIYVWIRFEILQGLAAIVALLHDSFFIIAVFSLLQLTVSIEFVAAVLTIVGYSINDTIVLFDRIRENMNLTKRVKDFSDLSRIVNQSIYQTLARSINTVLTVVIAALALLIFGNEAIRNFAFALTVGLVAGTYSSIFIAAQLWAIWKARALKRASTKPKEA